MEQVAHAVHEYSPRRTPFEWLRKPFRPESDCKGIGPVTQGITFRQSARIVVREQTVCERQCVAIRTSRADFRAAGDRVPRRIRPFDTSSLRHAAEYTCDPAEVPARRVPLLT